MKSIGFDCETHLIAPGQLFPKVVCITFFDGIHESIHLSGIGIPQIIKYLQDPNIRLVGHNVSFDLGVIAAEAESMGYDPHWILTLIFQAYADNRIADTMIRAMLIDIAKGTFQEIEGQRRGKAFGLDVLALKWCQIKLQKDDTWRLHYAYLDGKPLATWPQDAIDYAILDARATWLVDSAITQWVIAEGDPSGEVPDTNPQTRAAWVLHLMAGWGVRIDGSMVDTIKDALETQLVESYKVMDKYGLFKKDRFSNYKLTKKGRRCKDQKRLKELITQGYAQRGETPPMTKGRVNKQGVRVPEVSTSADTALESGHAAAMEYAHSANAEKLLSTYIPALMRGKQGFPITSNPNVMVASGRTSWQNPNWQNPPQVGGIRECVIPRPGNVFVAADLDTVELRALAQTCLEMFGHSQMAAALQRGEDLHSSLGADLLGVTYSQFIAMLAAGDPLAELTRQIAKKINFGLPGGMGVVKFAWTCANDGQPLDPDPAVAIQKSGKYKEAWFRRWPEMRLYLANAGQVCGDFGSHTIEQPWSGRIRGGLEYCSCANTLFQGRVADGTKLALWRLAWACYVDKSSPLYGCRLVLFLHDEVILEAPEGRAALAAAELTRILCTAVQEVIPDVPITSKPVIMRRWYKGAKPVNVNGVLVPCKPEKDKITNKTKWVHDAAIALAA